MVGSPAHSVAALLVGLALVLSLRRRPTDELPGGQQDHAGGRLALLVGVALVALATSVIALWAFSTPIGLDTKTYWSTMADFFFRRQPETFQCERHYTH